MLQTLNNKLVQNEQPFKHQNTYQQGTKSLGPHNLQISRLSRSFIFILPCRPFSHLHLL